MLGIYPNISNEQYHLHDSISRSKLIDFAVSPYNYWAMHLNPERPTKEATEAMIFGSAFHAFILEPDKYKEQFAIKPEGIDRRTNAGKAAYGDFLLHTAGKTILSMEQFNTLSQMNRYLHEYPSAMDLINGATYEQSYFWKDRESGLLVKSRPDILFNNMIVDLKTCQDASPQGFQRSMVSGSYHIQGAMVQDAVNELEGRFIETVINICVETKYPHAIGIYIIDEEALEAGRAKYKQLLVELKNCLEKNEWNGYLPQTIGLPKWAL